MKRNIKNMAFALLTLFAVTSCDLLEIDNYDRLLNNPFDDF